jgi:hypothetical protein
MFSLFQHYTCGPFQDPFAGSRAVLFSDLPHPASSDGILRTSIPNASTHGYLASALLRHHGYCFVQYPVYSMAHDLPIPRHYNVCPPSYVHYYACDNSLIKRDSLRGTSVALFADLVLMLIIPLIGWQENEYPVAFIPVCSRLLPENHSSTIPRVINEIFISLGITDRNSQTR